MIRLLLKLPLCLTLCLSLACCGRAKSEKLDPNPAPPAELGRSFKVIHVQVALCDNASQGIAPVPAKIGNGDDPANNLYWGCSDGARSIFAKSPSWKRLSAGKVDDRPEILERLVFQHQQNQAILVIDAWQGAQIKPCIRQFCQSLAGQYYESLKLKAAKGEATINLGGGADFLAFIGHNGLMEFQIPQYPANPNRKQTVSAAVFCCKSQSFFSGHLEKAGAKPVLLTASNMYPGAFLLHEVLNGWFANEDHPSLRQRAARAYAKNQGISTKGALTVFAPLP